MASLRDVAEAVGVSVSLVSKVLGGRGTATRISAETEARVREAADRLGYRKNLSALSLLAGRHNVIGAYLHNIGAPGSGIMEELISGISTELRRHHCSLMLNFFSTVSEFEELCGNAHSGVMDGLLVGGLYESGLLRKALAVRRMGLPVVTVFGVPLSRDLPNVGLSQEAMGEVATRHLIEGGARHIAHIANLTARLEGYRRALAKAGMDRDPCLVTRVARGQPGMFDHRVGEDAVRNLLRGGVTFDGIVAQSDNEAVGCMNVLLDAGCRVPHDVQVIGMDNAPFCELARVPLSSVSEEFRLRGQLSVQTLMAMIAGHDVASTVVPPRLVPRQSTRGSVERHGD